MEDFLLRYRKVIIIFSLSLAFLLVMKVLGGEIAFFHILNVEAQSSTSTAVGVSATVEAWLDFEATPTNVTLQPHLIQADGTVNIGSSTDIKISLGTNARSGWGIDIQGENGGLYSVTANHLIPTVTATSTLATGTDAYGANATSTYTGVSIGSYYDYYGTDIVGEISSTTARDLADKTSPNSFIHVANLKIKATVSETTPPATNYSDTITLTATAYYE